MPPETEATRQALPMLTCAAGEQHMGLVYHSWINELVDQLGEEPTPWLDRAWLAAAQHALIDTLLLRGAEVVCAVNPRDLMQVFGYAVVRREPRVLYWVYVRARFRQEGVAQRLLEDAFGSPDDGPVSLAMPTSKARWLNRWDLRSHTYALVEGTRHT
jgi:GNAT superfamily N-acetyltransferase